MKFPENYVINNSGLKKLLDMTRNFRRRHYKNKISLVTRIRKAKIGLFEKTLYFATVESEIWLINVF